MSSSQRRQQSSVAHRLAIWFGLIGGVAAWTGHLLIGYGLSSFACLPGAVDFTILGFGGYQFLIVLLTLVTAAVALTATAVSFVLWRRTSATPSVQQSKGPNRGGFLAFVGFLLSGLFFFVILLGGFAVFVLQSCAT